MNMQLDWQLRKHSVIWIVLILAIPLVQPLKISPDLVEWIEYGQTLFLLCCFMVTLSLTLMTDLKGKYLAFWLWASLWWLVLLGRDQNWGRQLVGGYSPVVYHVIAAILILGLIGMLFWPCLRAGIRYYVSQPFPVWDFLLAGVAFLLADAVERERWIARFVLLNPLYDDLLEELYEVPFMLALFSVSLYLQLYTVIKVRNKTSMQNS